MAARFDPPVEVDLGTNPQRVVFNTVEEARSWIDSEIAVWGESLIDKDAMRQLPPMLKGVISSQRTTLNQVNAALNDASNISEETCPPSDVVAKLQPFVTGQVLHSKSAIGSHAVKLLSEADSVPSRTSAIGFLAAAIGHQTTVQELQQGQNNPAQIGAFMAGLAAYSAFVSPGGDDVVQIFDGYLREKTSSWEQQLAVHQNEHFDAVVEIKKSRQEITDEHTRQETEFSDLKTGYENQFADFKEFYESGLRAKAPVKYWKSKALWHSLIGGSMVLVFLAGASVAAFYGFRLGLEFNESVNYANVAASVDAAIEEQPAGAGQTNPNQQDVSPTSLVQLAFTKFLVLLVPGFFAVWVLRIVLKVALGNLAIADDAKHRVTMVETFLSLMEHGDKLDEADRILMLQALFRPVPGSTDDDTGPPNWFDVMLQQVRKK